MKALTLDKKRKILPHFQFYSWSIKLLARIQRSTRAHLYPVCWLTFVCVQEFPPPGSWAERGPEWAGSRLRNWHRGWRRRERHSSTAKAFCGHDSHLDFRWGLGSLRAHCCPHSVHEINTQTSPLQDLSFMLLLEKKCKMGKNCKNFCHTRWKKWRWGKKWIKMAP